VNESLAQIARRVDAAVTQARADLVRAVRQASAEGMTQTAIAREIGRSQAEVNRLLRFHGTSTLGMKLRDSAAEVRSELAAAGGVNVRVFGSVARGDDDDQSDVDLLVDLRRPMSLMELSGLERRLAEIIGATVDLVPESSVRPDIKDEVVMSAVPL